MVDMILTIWVALIALALISLGAFTLARNTKAEINRSFATFALFLAIWVVTNCIGANFKTHSFSLYFSYADFFLGPVLVYIFWKFTHSQLVQAKEQEHIQRTTNRLLLAVTGIFSLLVLTNQIIHPQFADGVLNIQYRALYPLYASAVGLVAAISVWNILQAKKIARGALRIQLAITLWAVGIAAIALSGANLIVPQLTNSESVNLILGNVSYIGLVIFIGLITYAIVKHRLFDVRLVVARSIAYALVLAVLVVAYTTLSIVVSTWLPGGQHVAPLERAIYIALAIIAALVFPALKRFFDRITNKLFYQDAYDPQELLNELNKVLVTTADLSKLLNNAIAIISEGLKAEFFSIIVMDEEGKHANHMAGTTNKKFSVENLKVAHSHTYHTQSDALVVVADELDYKDATLRKTLNKYEIAMLVQLGQQDSGHVLGYMVMGPKKSGNPYTSQDIRLLEIIANEMVIAIQNALRFEEIEQFNETLQHRIEEKTRGLQRANEKLRQLDETKDDFISMASHQLRTPLTSVKGYVSMVVEGDAGELNPMQKKLLNQAFISAQRMVYLISDLLNVSRLRTGKFIIEPVQSNLSTVVAEEVRQLIPTAKGRGLELIYHKPEHFPILMFDETKMRQVIMNFIDNAIYYTQSGGTITVSLADKPHEIEFTVTDTGIGVPKAEQPHLFSKFYRADNAKRARPDGTGLGLFMAKKVIVAQGGATLFKSQESKGSTFGFTFAKEPLKPTRPPESHVLKH